MKKIKNPFYRLRRWLVKKLGGEMMPPISQKPLVIRETPKILSLEVKRGEAARFSKEIGFRAHIRNCLAQQIGDEILKYVEIEENFDYATQMMFYRLRVQLVCPHETTREMQEASNAD